MNPAGPAAGLQEGGGIDVFGGNQLRFPPGNAPPISGSRPKAPTTTLRRRLQLSWLRPGFSKKFFRPGSIHEALEGAAPSAARVTDKRV